MPNKLNVKNSTLAIFQSYPSLKNQQVSYATLELQALIPSSSQDRFDLIPARSNDFSRLVQRC